MLENLCQQRLCTDPSSFLTIQTLLDIADCWSFHDQDIPRNLLCVLFASRDILVPYTSLCYIEFRQSTTAEWLSWIVNRYCLSLLPRGSACEVFDRFNAGWRYQHSDKITVSVQWKCWFFCKCMQMCIRYDTIVCILTCSKKLTGSPLSLPHGINKKWKCETKNKLVSMIDPV